MFRIIAWLQMMVTELSTALRLMFVTHYHTPEIGVNAIKPAGLQVYLCIKFW